MRNAIQRNHRAMIGDTPFSTQNSERTWGRCPLLEKGECPRFLVVEVIRNARHDDVGAEEERPLDAGARAGCATGGATSGRGTNSGSRTVTKSSGRSSLVELDVFEQRLHRPSGTGTRGSRDGSPCPRSHSSRISCGGVRDRRRRRSRARRRRACARTRAPGRRRGGRLPIGTITVLCRFAGHVDAPAQRELRATLCNAC